MRKLSGLVLLSGDTLIKPFWTNYALYSDREFILTYSGIIDDNNKLTTIIKYLSSVDNFCFIPALARLKAFS